MFYFSLELELILVFIIELILQVFPLTGSTSGRFNVRKSQFPDLKVKSVFSSGSLKNQLIVWSVNIQKNASYMVPKPKLHNQQSIVFTSLVLFDQQLKTTKILDFTW